ncbi:MAG TPA: tetratricopeptide repeat protein [Balneolales bacterium]|nr:tetratricopeptide repeat protein [Balneolales bacterium]
MLLLLGGCHGALKSSWDNFTAYYNTFYNAKKYYKDGYREVVKQRDKINPERPIRIFERPVKISQDNFDQAISKSADILRNHSQSKWVDDALFLIGRSYFYETKFYSADQKFEELYNTTNNNVMRQKSVLWQGRVALEMDHYDDGLSLLSRELSSTDYKWNKKIKAQVQLVMAELYVHQQDWSNAEKLIQSALPYVNEKEIRARAYFLQGQLLERLGKLDEAYDSYTHVDETHPEYDLIYAAHRKQAEVARENGHLKLALNIFTAMSKDDKNFDILPELNYEIARTLEAMGRYRKAQRDYNYTLRNGLKTPDQATKAKIYYGLGNIYRDYYKNLSIAAAYYDSSANQASDMQKLPENFNATELSKSFGEYAKLKKDITNLDSLLWLGSLPKAQFDSVINVVKQRKIEELKERLKAQASNRNTLVNVNAARNAQQDNSGNNGFLNHRNPQLVAEASQAFKAIWGNRPLVDNWRRIQAVQQAGVTANSDTTKIAVSKNGAGKLENQIKVDLSKIPLTNDAKEKMRSEVAKKQYEIGNVFFLSLNLPDSAKRYYHHIINKYRETKLAPQAMYSLSELYYVNQDSIKAQQWADSVITNYPASIYALKLNRRYGQQVAGTQQQTALESTLQDSLQTLYYSLVDSVKHMEPVKSAEALRSFGLNHSISGYAPDALLYAARLYARKAREQAGFSDSIKVWISIQKKWSDRQDSLQQLKDTAQVKLKKTDISKPQSKYWKQILDTTLTKPDFRDHFPFQGQYWDSTRVVLRQLMNYFPNYTRKDVAKNIMDEITEPPPPSKAKKEGK